MLAGSGIIDANVVNNGIVSPGGPNNIGSLSIVGNFTQGSTGVLDMELASTKSIDQLMVSGQISFGGTMNVSLLNGFEPVTPDAFNILTFGSSSGKFKTINLPGLTDGDVLSAVFELNELTLATTGPKK